MVYYIWACVVEEGTRIWTGAFEPKVEREGIFKISEGRDDKSWQSDILIRSFKMYSFILLGEVRERFFARDNFTDKVQTGEVVEDVSGTVSVDKPLINFEKIF